MSLLHTKNYDLISLNKAYVDKQFMVHSRNLANANVSGAQAQYMQPFAQYMQRLPAKHTMNESFVDSNMRHSTVLTDNSCENMTISGNNINADQEMSQISQLTAHRKMLNELQKADLQLFNIVLR